MRIAMLTILSTFACYTLSANAGDSAELSESDICRAAISTIMGRPVHKILVERVARDGVNFLFYIRPEDRTTWYFKCFTEKNVVTWGNASGRWRVDPDDSIVKFAVSNEVLTITDNYSDGSKKEKRFTKADLEKPYR
ncbi:MAG: hypothetical protein WD672_03750 [Woeseia sp.]